MKNCRDRKCSYEITHSCEECGPLCAHHARIHDRYTKDLGGSVFAKPIKTGSLVSKTIPPRLPNGFLGV